MKPLYGTLGLLGMGLMLTVFGCKGEDKPEPTSPRVTPPVSMTPKTPLSDPKAVPAPDTKMDDKKTDAKTDPEKKEAPKAGDAPNTAAQPEHTTASGLKIQDLVVGTGKEAKRGDAVAVHYRGTLDDGTIFDESYKRGEPFPLMLGAGQVIKGWDEGLAGMKVGGKRRLTIPAALGYGSKGQGSIPPGATLHFDCELMGVE